MSLSDLPAYEKGLSAGCYCVESNNSGHGIRNPYPYDTPDWKAWNLGFDTVLRYEQP